MDNEKKVWITPKVEQLVFTNTESGGPGWSESGASGVTPS